MIEARFTKLLTVALEPKVYDRLKALTDEAMVSIAHWVRAAINQTLEKENESNKTENIKQTKTYKRRNIS